jgi:hypothetical protein
MDVVDGNKPMGASELLMDASSQRFGCQAARGKGHRQGKTAGKQQVVSLSLNVVPKCSKAPFRGGAGVGQVPRQE